LTHAPKGFQRRGGRRNLDLIKGLIKVDKIGGGGKIKTPPVWCKGKENMEGKGFRRLTDEVKGGEEWLGKAEKGEKCDLTRSNKVKRRGEEVLGKSKVSFHYNPSDQGISCWGETFEVLWVSGPNVPKKISAKTDLGLGGDECSFYLS